jgi:hypothetical protein
MTFQFIFPANPLKTSSPPFSPSRTAQQQVHNVAMIILRGRSLSLVHIFSFGFIRGEVEKNKKKFSKRSEPNLGKVPGPPRRLAPGGKGVFAARTRDVVENNNEGARRARLGSVQTKVALTVCRRRGSFICARKRRRQDRQRHHGYRCGTSRPRTLSWLPVAGPPAVHVQLTKKSPSRGETAP